MRDDLTIRRADSADLPDILELARRSLGWTDDDAQFLEWKHLQNPFGMSPMWVALDGDRIAGFRTFLRWEFVGPDGRRIVAARAVDTATDPDYQGRGIFTRLTLEAIEQLPADRVEMIFNTPNGKSLPGYLKMGWTEVGRLAVAVMPTSGRFPVVVATARRPAGRWPLPTVLGDDPADVFADRTAVQALLDSQPDPAAIATRRTPELLAWRYGYEPLGYRVLLRGPTPESGLAVFRRRQRGKAVEGVLCDVIVPEADPRVTRHLIDRVRTAAAADYLIRVDPRPLTLGPFVRLPRVGPVLACRPLDDSPAPALAAWGLCMGDVELF